MKRHAPIAGYTLGSLAVTRNYKTKADLARCFEAGKKAGLRGAAISTCHYAAPEKVAAWTAGWESARRAR